ncbi:cytochrome c [Limnohabitans sp. Rim8]|uniref:c-type cytochrome n=1 Tax=Limnohabitans sp. Rim8 TaxID=1100718 RepID=UPI00260E3982|nr:cytochrome c [Limnohabitans sp. Rim8]
MKTSIALILAALAAAIALPASAQFAKPEDAVKYRKASLTVMGAHFSRVGAMASGRVPFDAKVAAENADLVATLAKLPWAAFPEGTDKGDTRAKAEIWKDADKFKEAADRLQAESVKLQAAAKSGNLDAIKTAFGATGASCKACHDTFRKD